MSANGPSRDDYKAKENYRKTPRGQNGGSTL